MSEVKFTPGPWYVIYGTHNRKDGLGMTGTFDIKNQTKNGLDCKWLADVKPYGGSGFSDYEEAKANAHLIAAAPDMLNYMILMSNHIEKYVSGNVSKGEVLAEINAIIKKATGQLITPVTNL